ncbi:MULTISPECIES: pseudouridine synthase [Pseudoalteromonas]|uniref:pseudouridine synthase n=1 Tax=Pseudoalteromonas TaxID=53246 RepID=UPI0002D287C6|nr:MULTISPECIES: pseudouridine synthase [Pseudoalteromonas]AUJ68428.1 Ribosomal large subunit pseudouridine synthase F [Pseudoalteromonas sp. NC201]MCF7516067.1 rRNA pseudouridine synthase [Pseudoalteromonas sp. L7]MCF7528110.1 rRNA pseudouridine synthase [Pseudoalteromonas sp. L23]MCX2769522.1 pseudouridine synthase [Pseudoalteromonas sp. B530]
MSYPMRLAKYLSHCGVCSRRQASRLIDSARVTVNGRLANHIDHINLTDSIMVDGELVAPPQARRLFVYHKPVGIDCKVNPDDPASIYHVLPKSCRVYPIGRLDKDSRGLLLLTNDGALCQQLIHPDHHQEKEYEVQVDKPLDPGFCLKMAAGVPVKGQITLPCTVEQIAHDRFRIVLRQGLNRQIRRMAHHCGYRVIDLYRVRIANLALTQLEVNSAEVKEISAELIKLT